jgi:hypothetical protein
MNDTLAARHMALKTREWQMDTMLFGASVERPDTDVGMKLEFRKARERTPLTRAGFADFSVALFDDAWTYSNPDGGGCKLPPSPHGKKFLDALRNALVDDGTVIVRGTRSTLCL